MKQNVRCHVWIDVQGNDVSSFNAQAAIQMWWNIYKACGPDSEHAFARWREAVQVHYMLNDAYLWIQLKSSNARPLGREAVQVRYVLKDVPL